MSEELTKDQDHCTNPKNGSKLLSFVAIATVIFLGVLGLLFVKLMRHNACFWTKMSTYIYVLTGILFAVYVICVAIAVKVYNDQTN